MANWRDYYALALGVGALLGKRLRPALPPPHRSAAAPAGPGISVVIPSRDGRHLLERILAGVEADLRAGEILVIDNGSTDGTADYLRRFHPAVRMDVHSESLSFARAANRGAELARYSRLCLLNNDMEIEPGFFAALEMAFDEQPDLFCASAQIFFPEGARREETGKTAMHRADRLTPDDYPVFCDVPLPGEDSSPVLYGSGGCSLYDREKFLELGGFDEFYEPVYVEDLDLGYRAWLRGWSSVYVARARVLHRHRATSSRFYTPETLQGFLDRNHARFLLRAVRSLEVFVPYYRHAMTRRRLTDRREVFRAACAPPQRVCRSEREILDLTGGAVRVFPGRAPERERKVLLSAGVSRPSLERLRELARTAAVYYLAYCRPRSTPDGRLLEACRAVIFVDGTAGSRPYQAALQEVGRRYCIEEVLTT